MLVCLSKITFFVLSQIRFLCVDLVVLELIQSVDQAGLKSQRSACLCLPRARVKGVHHCPTSVSVGNFQFCPTALCFHFQCGLLPRGLEGTDGCNLKPIRTLDSFMMVSQPVHAATASSYQVLPAQRRAPTVAICSVQEEPWLLYMFRAVPLTFSCLGFVLGTGSQ